MSKIKTNKEENEIIKQLINSKEGEKGEKIEKMGQIIMFTNS